MSVFPQFYPQLISFPYPSPEDHLSDSDEPDLQCRTFTQRRSPTQALHMDYRAALRAWNHFFRSIKLADLLGSQTLRTVFKKKAFSRGHTAVVPASQFLLFPFQTVPCTSFCRRSVLAFGLQHTLAFCLERISFGQRFFLFVL